MPHAEGPLTTPPTRTTTEHHPAENQTLPACRALPTSIVWHNELHPASRFDTI